MVPERATVRLSEIIFDETIYPRKDHDPAIVQRYAEQIEVIESDEKYICLTPDKKLLDGKHRWLGYRKAFQDNGDREIPVLIYPVTTEAEQFLVAVRLNSKHGQQLAEADKQQSAVRLWELGYSDETIASELSVKTDTARKYLSRKKKEDKEKRNAKIFDLWMSCHTDKAIAGQVNISEEAVRLITQKMADVPELGKPEQAAADHATDFDIPIYNVWKQQTKSNTVDHFGNSEVRWVDNLLYLYTKPFGVVVDPFAGGGSTIDVCRKRFRRYWASDRLPLIEREQEIRRWDMTEGLPPLPWWKDVSLVYLDPPYWKQAEGQYSNDPTDLANMPIEQFTEALAGIVNGFGAKLSDAYIALIIQPTQWKAPDRAFVDHIGDMLRAVKLPVEMRYSVPYESQQCTAQMVEWAKAHRRCLVLSREIVVWRVG